MKHNLLFLVLTFIFSAGCKSNPHKAEQIETNMEKSSLVSGSTAVGVKKGDMVVQDKVQMSEKLRDLQNGVYSLEDKVYGTRKLGSLGLYGDLKSCRRKLASRQFGGSGTMMWTEPLDRVTDKEEEMKIGLDEKKDLVGVTEEYLKDRLARFTGYKTILQKRSDEFAEKIETCKAELAAKDMDANESNKVMVQEAPKASSDRAAINQYMCGFVRSGASLQALMMNAFAKGWLSLSDFKLDQNLIAASLKDAKGSSRDNGMLFNGWKLSFDNDKVTVGELLEEGKDARLQAWSYTRKEEVPGATQCLAAADGVWNR
ncbi:MAG: hypothetical protein KF799_11395 [Bdellovibrionales bacterium]|nr:hypothetical protein [Bdellovibrionales bacterium]